LKQNLPQISGPGFRRCTCQAPFFPPCLPSPPTNRSNQVVILSNLEVESFEIYSQILRELSSPSLPSEQTVSNQRRQKFLINASRKDGDRSRHFSLILLHPTLCAFSSRPCPTGATGPELFFFSFFLALHPPPRTMTTPLICCETSFPFPNLTCFPTPPSAGRTFRSRFDFLSGKVPLRVGSVRTCVSHLPPWVPLTAQVSLSLCGKRRFPAVKAGSWFFWTRVFFFFFFF